MQKLKSLLSSEKDRPNVDKPVGGVDNLPLYYPDAEIPDFKMLPRGTYAKGWPQGAVVHFTAGRSKNEHLKRYSLRSAKNGAEQGYMFFTIGSDGNIVQAFKLNQWGYHAGKSAWHSLGQGVSRYLVGIEVCCAGKLEPIKDGSGNYKSWFNEVYTHNEVRYSADRENIQDGAYHKYTDEQEHALTELLIWLKMQCPQVFKFDLVLGHDEVAPDRKNDPGASLSMSMPEYRRHLRDEYYKRVKA